MGSLRSINPYNPYLGLWTSLEGRAKWYGGQLHHEEALSREQAIRFYTINTAYPLLLEGLIGSLEEGKFADFVVLDRDLLTCPVDANRDTQGLRTFLRVFFQAEDGIRVRNVTGVQTCALPILSAERHLLRRLVPGEVPEPDGVIARAGGQGLAVRREDHRASLYFVPLEGGHGLGRAVAERSEERRVGKECRARWAACDYQEAGE